MDKLAKQAACQLFIEQEIEKGLAEGKTKYAIGHEIAKWIKKFFEAEVTPKSIEMRARRMDIVTNVTNEPTQGNHSETPSKNMGIMEREILTRPITEQEEVKESTALWQLKRWWKLASKKDRTIFQNWIDQN